MERWTALTGKREARTLATVAKVEGGQVTDQGVVLSTRIFQGQTMGWKVI